MKVSKWNKVPPNRCSPCVVGAIGDVDGDGNLDLVASFELEPVVQIGGLSQILEGQVAIVKVNLADSLATRHYIPINATVATEMKNLKIDTNLTDLTFKAISKQPWTAYMGTKGDSIYHAQH